MKTAYAIGKWKNMEHKLNGKAMLGFVAALSMLTGVVLGIVTYTWTTTWTVTNSTINGVITVSATHYEVGYPQSISVNITNNRAINTTGILTVQILNSNGTIASTLFARSSITIQAQRSWVETWTWTPTAADTYTAKATYEEN